MSSRTLAERQALPASVKLTIRDPEQQGNTSGITRGIASKICIEKHSLAPGSRITSAVTRASSDVANVRDDVRIFMNDNLE